MLNAALILSDTRYEGWQPGKEDLIDIQLGLLCFVDKYGRPSLKEGQWFEEDEERGTDSNRSTSSENTPSPRSVPSVERTVSESSSNDLSDGSPGSIEEAARTSLNTAAANEATRPAPGPIGMTEAATPANVQPGNFISGTSGGPSGPPPEGRFFHNPVNLRTLMTGSGDGYRSPEPATRLDAIFPHHHTDRERAVHGGSSTNSGFHPSGMATERTGPSFSAQQPAVTQSHSAGPGMGHGHGPRPLMSNSLVLPAELMVYNELMMDIGTGQYLGAEMGNLGLPPFIGGGGINGLGTNGHQWQGISQNLVHEPPQAISSFGYPQPSQPHHGVDRTSGQQTGVTFGGQWHTGGTIDYR